MGMMAVFGRLAAMAVVLSALLLIAGCAESPRRYVIPDLILAPCNESQRPPQLAWRKEAEYTEEDKKLGRAGVVYIKVEVGTDGRVRKADFVQAAGDAVLKDAALQAALQCVFDPACSNGHPVPVTLLISYKFPPEPWPVNQRRR